MFILEALLFNSERGAVRGLFALLHAFSRIQNMRESRPFLLGLLQQSIDQLHPFMQFHVCAPWSMSRVNRLFSESAQIMPEGCPGSLCGIDAPNTYRSA